MNRLLNALRAVSGAMYRVQKIILLVLVLVMVIVNMAQVTGRYALHFSLSWSEQVSVIIFIALIMLGGNIAIRGDSEIRISFLSFKSPKANAALGLVVDILSLATIIFFLVSSCALVGHAFKFKQVVSSMQLSYAYVFMFLPLGFALMGFDKLVNIAIKIGVLAGIESQGGRA